jgi:hypothetical protein
MITKSIITGLISILSDGQIQIRQDTVIIEDTVELSRTYHREVLEPGQDVSDKDQRIQDVCAVVWTPEVVAEFDAAKLARNQAAIEVAKESI